MKTPAELIEFDKGQTWSKAGCQMRSVNMREICASVDVDEMMYLSFPLEFCLRSSELNMKVRGIFVVDVQQSQLSG